MLYNWKKMRVNFWMLWAFFFLALQGCYLPEEGALSQETRTELNSFAASTAEVQKKYIKLMEKMVLLLEEVRDIPENDLAMDRLRKFYADDQYALRQINREINGWYRFASDEDISYFLTAIQAEPNAIKLQSLIPATRQRFSYNLDWEKECNLLLSFLKLHR